MGDQLRPISVEHLSCHGPASPPEAKDMEMEEEEETEVTVAVEPEDVDHFFDEKKNPHQVVVIQAIRDLDFLGC